MNKSEFYINERLIGYNHPPLVIAEIGINHNGCLNTAKKMPKEKAQLNIKINPKLLLRIKAEAIKNGMTLTEFVTRKLENIGSISNHDVLEQRLAKIEQHLNLDKNSSDPEEATGTIFSDVGATNYGYIAKKLFNSFLIKKGLSKENGLKELAVILAKIPYSYPELIFQILLGNHDLTGLEMTEAYKMGSCAMRTALSDWTNDSLEPLNEAFLSAVITKSLK